MESKFKVGDDFIGFKFHETHTLMYEDDMDDYIGKKGKIVRFDIDRNILVSFDGKEIWYPYPGQAENDIHAAIQSLKDKYPQFNITVSVEDANTTKK